MYQRLTTPEAAAPSAGPVFLNNRAADSILQRHKRHNSGVFEELLEGNLERECKEEKCDLEEAREVFENDERTMEFWAFYIDEDQCKSNPCLNQGTCNDLLGFYSCSCVTGFTGRNCEIVLAKRCDVNNGNCMHFCNSVGIFGATCSCAKGYKLMPDSVSCEAEVEFPCGRTALTGVRSFLRSALSPDNVDSQNTTSQNETTPSPTPPSTPAGTTEFTPTASAPVRSRFRKKLPLWALSEAETPPEEAPRPFKRIVGGSEAFPGEIPWQVGLVTKQGGRLFCGGSILSRVWVITAAHCLVEAHGSFLVRVGEHNINIDEGTEEDHEILHQHIHPLYNASLSSYNHDIALLHLRNPINFSATVRPICVGPLSFTEALVREESPATVSGWGLTRFLGSASNTLQKVDVPFIERTECKKSSSARITPAMFCAGYYDQKKDACQGDSGGPHANSLHDTWFLTGIVSWGEECAKEGKYGVYTRVSVYYRWINHVMGVTKRRVVVNVVDYEN